MAELLSIKELLFQNGLDRDNGGNTKKNVYQLTFDEPMESLEEVERLSTFELSQRNDINPSLVLNDISIEAQDNKVFLLSASWIPEQFSFTSDTESGETRADVQINTWWLDRVVTADAEDGSAIEDSAHSPPSVYPTVRVPQEEIVIKQRERSIDFSRAQDQGKLNNSQVKIAGRTIPKYCCMLMSYSYVTGYDEEGFVYYEVTYVFRTNYTKNAGGDVIGFKYEWLDAGFNGWNTVTLKPYTLKFKGDKGTPTNPVKLDGAGKPLSPQTLPPVYNENVLHFLTDFSGYPIPSEWPYGAA